MLLKAEDLKPRAEAEPEGEDLIYRSEGNSSRTVIGKAGTPLPKLIGKLRQNETIHIPTRGNWSSHHLIEYVLEQIGPAEVWLTTWSVKEQAIRVLVGLTERGLITDLHAIFDERAKVQCPQAHQLALSQIGDMRLTKIHAKVIVMMNDEWGVTVVTSANLTRNPRIERFVIFTDRQTAEFDRDWIQAELKDAKTFGV